MIKKLFTLGAAVVAVLAFAAPANAVAPTQLDVGTNTTGDHPITAVNSGAITVTMGSLTLGCTSASAGGVVHAGSPLANPYMEFTSTNFVGCTGPGGFEMKLTQSCNLEIGALATASATNAVTDSIASALTVPAGCLSAEDVPFGGAFCSLDVQGSVNGTFEETAQDLVISGSGLQVQGVSGCLGQVSNGDPVSFTITFDITSPNGAINLKP